MNEDRGSTAFAAWRPTAWKKVAGSHTAASFMGTAPVRPSTVAARKKFKSESLFASSAVERVLPRQERVSTAQWGLHPPRAPWYPPSRPGPADAAPCRGGAFSFCSSKPHAGPAPRTPEAKGQVLSEAEYHRYTRLQSLTQEAETHIRALKHAERNIHADIHPHSVPAGIGEWAYWWEGDEGTGMAAGRDVLSAHREREQDVFTRLHRTKCRENVSERLSLLSRELPVFGQITIEAKKRKNNRLPPPNPPPPPLLPAELVCSNPMMRNEMLHRVEVLEGRIQSLAEQLSAAGQDAGDWQSQAIKQASDVKQEESAWVYADRHHEKAIGEPLDLYEAHLEHLRREAKRLRRDLQGMVSEASSLADDQRRILRLGDGTAASGSLHPDSGRLCAASALAQRVARVEQRARLLATGSSRAPDEFELLDVGSD